MSTLRVKPWRPFRAVVDGRRISKFLDRVAKDSEKAFHKGMRSAKSGVIYTGRSGRRIRASSPGQYPAIDTGDLDRSISSRVTKDSATIGTSMFYAKFLREGTRMMRRRRMSDDALTEGIKTARHELKEFVKWERK